MAGTADTEPPSTEGAQDDDDDASDLEASFQDVDLDAEPARRPADTRPTRLDVRQQRSQAGVIGASYGLPMARTSSQTSSHASASPHSTPTPAPLGRLGMGGITSARSSVDSTHAPWHAADAHGAGPSMIAHPPVASTSSFDFAAAAREAATAAESDIQVVVSNDHEGTFESVSMSPAAQYSQRMGERLGSAATANGGGVYERPPSVRHSSAPEIATVNGVSEPEATRSQTPPPASTSPTTSPSKSKRASKSQTTLQKVISRTRQKDLPPKERNEDIKHLREFTTMMSQSREHEKKKRAERQAKRQSREMEMQSQLPSWERDIAPNWKVVLADPNLRRLWWDGTMPARLRANLWSASIGNALAIGKSSFARSLALAKSWLSTGRLSADLIDVIETDMEQTLPRLKLFQRGGPMWDDLHNLLVAYSVFQRDRPYYPEGASWPAALLLISMPVPDAFVCLANLVEKSFLKSFYAPKHEEIDAYYRIFGTLLADAMPPVYRNFLSIDIRPPLYLYPWLTTCFARFLPVDCATRIFDVFLLEGDSFLFRVALALLEALEARLFNPDRDEVAATFSASDRGARSVVARANGWRDETDVLAEDVYISFVGSEDRIFAILRQQDWREPNWLRLVERELPE